MSAGVRWVLVWAAMSPALGFAEAAFSDGQATLPGLVHAGAAWADFDNDGDLDLILAGFENLGGDRLQLWRNDQDGFVPVGAGLPSAAYGRPLWADFDRNGDLDLALLVPAASTSSYATEIWHNQRGLFNRAVSVPAGKFGAHMACTDFDADGDVDLFLAVLDLPESPVSILRNEQGSYSQQWSGVRADLFAAADYDGDGDADLAAQSGSVLRVWRNAGGVFLDTHTSFPELTASALSWVDEDHDGDLDLLVCGQTGTGPSAQDVVILSRNSKGVFSQVPSIWPAFTPGALAWADLNNDGWWDLAGVVMQAGTLDAHATILYRTSGGGVLAEPRFAFQFLSATAAADYDRDGDLDLLLSGGTTHGALLTQLLRNESATSNRPPSAPAGLSATVSGADVTLTWQPASDAETPSLALTYNLRVGTSPGGIDVVSPDAELDSGRRRVAQIGNAAHGPSKRFVLPHGTYYCSVQAVDSGFAGGPFSPEVRVTVAAPAPMPATFPASGLTPTQATLHGEVDARGLSTSVAFEWGTTPAYGQTTVWQSLSGTGWKKVNETLSGLEVEATYYYRLVAKSDGGTNYGSTQVLTTRRFLAGLSLGREWFVADQAWADCDGDGRLDLLLSAFDPAAALSVLQLWRNQGSSFTLMSSGLPPLDGAVAWGDFDRDGDLDLVCSGRTDLLGPPSPVTQVWRNAGGAFQPVNHQLPGAEDSKAAWGDYDNDGDLDLLITGTAFGEQTTQIWRNDVGTFAPAPCRFPALVNPRAVWADLDGDADLDILLMGSSDAGPLTQLFRNESGLFIERTQRLRGFEKADAAPGDFDNDGDLDLAVGGRSRDSNGVAEWTVEVWSNDGGALIPNAIALSSVQQPQLAWGDYDNDGDLDLAVSSGPFAAAQTCQLLRNDNGGFTSVDTGLAGGGALSWADYDQDSDLDLLIGGAMWRNETQHPNTPPLPPASLGASLVEGRVQFTWSPATDTQTPGAGLTYDLWVGTQPSLADVASAQADRSTGFRLLPQGGKIQGTQAFLSALRLPLGRYYWSVQAVDSGLAGGPFAPVSSFEITPGPPLVDRGAVLAEPKQARIRSTVHPRGLATTVWIEWGKGAEYGQALPCPDLSGSVGLDLNEILAGLEVETVYHFRVAARNSAGSTYGPGQTFTTQRFTALDITPTLHVTAADWGDLDRDGDPDLVVCGTDPEPVTQIWLNDRLIFRRTLTRFPGLRSGIVSWGDFDHDGDLDLLLCGDGLTQVWRNNAGSFSVVAALPGLSEGGAAWGDFDNDGDLDVVLAGWERNRDIVQVWRNQKGTFAPSGIELPQLAWPHASWLDYDRDGDLDLLLAGADFQASPWLSSTVQLWLNQDGVFSRSTLDLPAFGIASLTWGDYDADGRPDLVLGYGTTASQIWRSQGSTFTDTGVRLPGLSNGSFKWGDYDGDGDLDLALAGHTPSGTAPQIWQHAHGTFVQTEAGLNNAVCTAWADFDLDGDLDLLSGSQLWRNEGVIQNTPPSVPTALNEQVTGNRVSFAWNAASDDRTPAAGLLYDFDFASGAPDQIGSSEFFALGSRQRSTGTYLHLGQGIYYWRVRAVDSALVPSPWSTERRVVVSADRDLDGLPDVWEAAHGLDPDSNRDAAADHDGDGFTNAEEFQANTNPRDSSSSLAITALAAEGPDLLVAFSSARAGRYRLEKADTSPHGPWTVVQSDIPGDGGVVTVRIAGGDADFNLFYRVISH